MMGRGSTWHHLDATPSDTWEGFYWQCSGDQVVLDRECSFQEAEGMCPSPFWEFSGAQGLLLAQESYPPSKYIYGPE